MYFQNQRLDPLGAISRYKPPESVKRTRVLSAGQEAALQVLSVSGMGNKLQENHALAICSPVCTPCFAKMQ